MQRSLLSRLLTFVSLIFLITVAQIQADGTAAVPEQLAIGVRGGEVRLSWRIPDGYDQRFFVFMHDEAVTGENIEQAQLIAVLPAGSDQYTEQITERGEYHFAVVTENEDREPSNSILPGENATQRAVRVTFEPTAPPPPSSADVPESEPEPEPDAVLSMRATTQGNRVRLSVRTSSDTMRVTILRTLEQPDFTSEGQQSYHVVGTAEGTSIQMHDELVPGITTWYTAVESGSFAEGRFPELRPGVNTLRSAISVGPVLPAPPIDTRVASGNTLRRETILDVRTDLGTDTGRGVPPPALERVRPADLDEATRAAVERMVSTFAPESGTGEHSFRARATVRPTEEEAASIENSYLRQIIGMWSAHGDVEQTNTNLRLFLAHVPEGSESSTARFYLGRSEYERGNGREALYQFLLVNGEEAQDGLSWIRAILDDGLHSEP